MDDLEDVIREFLVESHENLDRLDQDLIVLEADPASRQTLASVFRTIHTIKGTCGFLGFSRLEAVTHSGENLLSRLRDGRVALTPEITSALWPWWTRCARSSRTSSRPTWKATVTTAA